MLKYREFECRIMDGAVLYAREWQPERSQPRGVIILVHGLGEHSGRYAEMAAEFTRAGFALSTFDLRGHGQSSGRRGDTPSYARLLDDLDCFRRDSVKRFPDLPAFLYGHSLGGNLVLNYVLCQQPELAGVIVTSPWLRLAVEPPAVLKALVRFISKLWPTLSLSKGPDSKAFSHDPAIINAYKDDPLVHHKISLRLFTAMDQAASWARENPGQFNIPLLLMHGGADRITSSQATREFAAGVPEDCTLKIWQGLYHELHNELEKKEILAYVIKWLNSRSLQEFNDRPCPES